MRRFLSFFRFFGLDFSLFKKTFFGLGFYFRDLRSLKKQRGSNKDFPFGKKYPVLFEKELQSGNALGHYFNQDLLVAQKIFKKTPKKHVDIGSRIDGFVAHLAVFRKVVVFDVRELSSGFKNISFRQIDLTLPIDSSLVNFCDSISSLHAIEHFGLGRYGDPVDYNGHLKAIKNITKILSSAGVFYFSVPIGPQRIEFNAHRVFSLQYLIDLFKKDYSLVSFSYIDDSGVLSSNISLTPELIKTNCGCFFGCGVFEWKKN